MGSIFVSYRRQGTAGHAGRLFDRLRDHFGSRRVFRDVDQLKPGEDFVETLARAVAECEVFIVVIGRGWLDVRNERGERRLDDPEDFVRLELETALRRKVLVLPVLVEGATMVEAKDLPEPLRPLARRQAIELSEHRWDFDVQQLISRINEVVRPDRPVWYRRGLLAASIVLLVSVVGFGLISLRSGSAGRVSVLPPGHVPPDTVAPDTTPAAEPDTVLPTTGPRGGVTEEPDPPPGDEPRPLLLPDLVGTPVREAVRTLTDLGVTRRTESRYTGRAAAGTVVGQTPRAGTAIEPRLVVRLTIEESLQAREHAAGSSILGLNQRLNLDRDETEADGWDVRFAQDEQGFHLAFANGAVGVRLSTRPEETGWLFRTAEACAAQETGEQTLSLRTRIGGRVPQFGTRVAIPADVQGQYICVTTTRQRTAVLLLRGVAASPAELTLSYSTLRSSVLPEKR